MPDVSKTGFALMSDWPGVEDYSLFYLLPTTKLCDIISMWHDSLEELNPVRVRQPRIINLTYRNRCVHVCLHVCDVCGYVHVCNLCVGMCMCAICVWVCARVQSVCGYVHVCNLCVGMCMCAICVGMCTCVMCVGMCTCLMCGYLNVCFFIFEINSPGHTCARLFKSYSY